MPSCSVSSSFQRPCPAQKESSKIFVTRWATGIPPFIKERHLKITMESQPAVVHIESETSNTSPFAELRNSPPKNLGEFSPAQSSASSWIQYLANQEICGKGTIYAPRVYIYIYIYRNILHDVAVHLHTLSNKNESSASASRHALKTDPKRAIRVSISASFVLTLARNHCDADCCQFSGQFKGWNLA